MTSAIGQNANPLAICKIGEPISGLTTGANSFIAPPEVDYSPLSYPGDPEFNFYGSAHLNSATATFVTATFDTIPPRFPEPNAAS